MEQNDDRLLIPGDIALLHAMIDGNRNAFSISEGALSGIIEVIQAEATKLKRIISALQRHYNDGLVYILRLPDEILQEIFRCVANMEEARSPIKVAITMGVVCRRWRRIAQNTPTIWDRIRRDDASWVSYAIERSRSMPLSVSWTRGDPNNRGLELGALRLAIQNAHRVKSLMLMLPRSWFNALDHLLFQPSPMLETLILDSEGGIWEPSFAPATDSHNLHWLSLDHVLLPWPACAHSWKNLAHLEIQYSEGREPERLLTLDDLIKMFAEMTRLETVRLSQTIGGLESERPLSDDALEAMIMDTEDIPRPQGRIVARYLRTFACTVYSTHAAFELARHLDIPSFCSVACTCIEDPSGDSSPSEVLGFLSLLTQGQFVAHLQLGTQFLSPGVKLDLKAATATPNDAYQVDSDVSRAIILTCCRIPETTYQAVIARIWYLMSMQRTRTLQLALGILHFLPWSDISSTCQEIDHVVLETPSSVSSFVEALQDTTQKIAVPPNLRHITVTARCDLPRSGEHDLADALWRLRGEGDALQRLDVVTRYPNEVLWEGLANEVRVETKGY